MITDKDIALKKKSGLDMKVSKKLVNIASSADKRGIYFCMTFNEVKKLLNTKKCFFTGGVLNDIPNDPMGRTFDRIDNDKGYIDGNVVACSREFNLIKGELTVPQLKLIVKGLKRKKIW